LDEIGDFGRTKNDILDNIFLLSLNIDDVLRWLSLETRTVYWTWSETWSTNSFHANM